MRHILFCRCFTHSKEDAVDAKSVSFSIELPPPGEARVPYSDIPTTRASTMERPPHYREEGSIGEASYHGPPSRHSGSHRGSADFGTGKMGGRESYHGSREPVMPPERVSYHGSRDVGPPPRTSSRQEMPRYGSRQGSREPVYEPPRKEPYRGSREDLPYDSLRKEPYRSSREQLPNYRGDREYDEPYRGSRENIPRDPYRGSRENIPRDPYRSSSREYLPRDEPPYRPRSREDLRPDYEKRSLSNRSLHDEFEVDDDQGSEML